MHLGFSSTESQRPPAASNPARGLQAAVACGAPGRSEPAFAVVALCGVNAALPLPLRPQRAFLPSLCSSRLCGANAFSPPDRRAFTLIELVLVMAILIVVLAVSAPSLANFFRGRTLDSEARRFLSLTHYAQSRAISEGIPMQLWIANTARTYGLHADPGYAPDDPKAVQYELAPDLQLEITVSTRATTSTRAAAPANANANAATTTLRFQPDGFLPPDSPAGIRFRGADDATLTLAQSRNRLNYEIQSDTPR